MIIAAKPTYDFIIIGGGSAGCALANRLSADPANRVLVLEAGRPDSLWDLFIHMPAALSIPIGNKRYDWMYRSEPEPYMKDRRIYHGRGKVLGGSSSINGMIFQRGNPADYQRWAVDPGMASWDYAHCLPYFKRMENRLAGADDYRGGQGPLALERGPADSSLFDAFFAAVGQAGYDLTEDVNGYRQEGFAAFDRNIRGGRRLSAARAYLHPVIRRPNLEVRCRTLVCRILFEGHRAVGVEFRPRAGKSGPVRATAGEIICCGGAINSPHLLKLSGIGPAPELEALGIDPVLDLKGVGENLQDHLEVYVQHACRRPVSMQPALKRRHAPWIGLQWLLGRGGPASSNHFEAGGFVRGAESTYPNLMIHFLPLAVRYDGSVPASDHGYQLHIGPMNSESRGSVRLKTADPSAKPALRFNYLSTAKDRREWVEAIKCARRILGQPAWAPFDNGELSPGPAVQTPAQILDWVATDGETAYHPSCSCKMGLDDQAVLHPASLRVHGLAGLRVVDASAMPYITNGNIYAPTMMLAEKAADLILGNTPPPPEYPPLHHLSDIP